MRLTVSGFLQSVERNNRTFVAAALCILMAAGLVYAVSLGSQFRYPDENDYYTLARNLATSRTFSFDGIQPTAGRPPGFPIVLSVFFYLGADILLVRLLNFVFLSGSIFFLYTLLSKTATKTAAVFGVILSLCYPVLFYAAGTLYPQTLSSFLLLLFVYLVFECRPQSIVLPTLAGFVMGLLILVIPTFVPFLGVTLIVMYSRLRPRASALIMAAIFVIVGLWTIRNYQVFHSFVPISTNSGSNLLFGRPGKSTPNSGANVEASPSAAQAAKTSEVDRDADYRSQAVRFVINNPTQALSRYFSNLLNYFNYRNELATKSEASVWNDLLMLITYGPLLTLFLLRFFFLKQFPLTKIETYFVIIYLSSALFQAIFFTRIRYRLPFDLLLIGSVAIFLSNILTNFTTRATSPALNDGTNHA